MDNNVDIKRLETRQSANKRNMDMSDLLRMYATAALNKIFLPTFIAKNFKRISRLKSSNADLVPLLINSC